MSFSNIVRVVLLPFVVSSSFFVLPVSAQTYTLEASLTRINISGRQRMFAQRMAGLSCLIGLGIDTETHTTEVLEIRDRYAATLQNLRAGNAEIGISAEADISVKKAIAATYAPFREMSDLLSVLETGGTLTSQNLLEISNVSNRVFETAATLTSKIQASRSASLQDLTLIRSMIMNMSGRQRMLAEKASKEFCMAQAGVETEKNLERLTETVSIFDNTLEALINGMPGVILPPPNELIKAKLVEVRSIWEPAKSSLERAIDGLVLDDTEIHLATEELEIVRSLMNEAVALYDSGEGS